MDEITNKVARQYTEYAYPPPPDDLTATASMRPGIYCDPGLYGPLLWPEGRAVEGLDILVAGCGTFQAAVLAFHNPTCRVVGIDLSPASLGHHAYLREKHELSNPELFQGDIHEVGGLGRSFDYVVSTGVLHHLPDPSVGLAALRDTLRPGGAMFLMVYGATLRTGVYMLQDAFRRMGLTMDDAPKVRAMLEALPSHHFIHAYLKVAPDLGHDVGVVDTFLHPQDAAYDVPGLLAWVRGAGLEFQGWAQNHIYYPQSLVRGPAVEITQALPDEEQWAVVEKLLCVAGTHSFVCRHPGEARRPGFGAEGLSLRPLLRPDAVITANNQLEIGKALYDPTQAELAVIRLATGAATIAEIMDDPAFAAFPAEQREAYGRSTFERLWKIGAVFLGV